MINDIITMIKNIKTVIEFVLCEIHSIQGILEITNEQFPIYAGAIYSLRQSINNIQQIYTYNIPIEHSLKFALLSIIHEKLRKFSKLLKQFIEWDSKIIKPTCISCSQILFLLSNPRPSIILKRIEKTFNEISPVIKEQIQLEEKILGTAIRIKHPILQKAWLMVGENQLGETELPANVLIENLYSMFLVEQNFHIPKKEFIIDKICKLVHGMDGIAGSKPDDKISITELNLFKTTEENSKSVQSLLEISDTDLLLNASLDADEQEDENENAEETITEEEYKSEIKEINEIFVSLSSKSSKSKKIECINTKNVEIPIDFHGPVTVNYLGKRTIREPVCNGYGCDFNNIRACDFIVPYDLYEKDNYVLCGIDIECIATDQRFGGTNQCHMHYQINEKTTVKSFQVDRYQFPTNTYKFSIPPDSVKLGDMITLWIFSPSWTGWSMTLFHVKATARFVPCGIEL